MPLRRWMYNSNKGIAAFEAWLELDAVVDEIGLYLDELSSMKTEMGKMKRKFIAKRNRFAAIYREHTGKDPVRRKL